MTSVNSGPIASQMIDSQITEESLDGKVDTFTFNNLLGVGVVDNDSNGVLSVGDELYFKPTQDSPPVDGKMYKVTAKDLANVGSLNALLDNYERLNQKTTVDDFNEKHQNSKSLIGQEIVVVQNDEGDVFILSAAQRSSHFVVAGQNFSHSNSATSIFNYSYDLRKKPTDGVFDQNVQESLTAFSIAVGDSAGCLAVSQCDPSVNAELELLKDEREFAKLTRDIRNNVLDGSVNPADVTRFVALENEISLARQPRGEE